MKEIIEFEKELDNIYALVKNDRLFTCKPGKPNAAVLFSEKIKETGSILGHIASIVETNYQNKGALKVTCFNKSDKTLSKSVQSMLSQLCNEGKGEVVIPDGKGNFYFILPSMITQEYLLNYYKVDIQGKFISYLNSARNIRKKYRQSANDMIKNNKDEYKKYTKEIDAIHQEFTKKVENFMKKIKEFILK